MSRLARARKRLQQSLSGAMRSAGVSSGSMVAAIWTYKLALNSIMDL